MKVAAASESVTQAQGRAWPWVSRGRLPGWLDPRRVDQASILWAVPPLDPVGISIVFTADSQSYGCLFREGLPDTENAAHRLHDEVLIHCNVPRPPRETHRARALLATSRAAWEAELVQAYGVGFKELDAKAI